MKYNPKKIKQRRKAVNISQDLLAKAIGTSRPHIAHLERGSHQPNLRTLIKIARVLNVPISFFFD